MPPRPTLESTSTRENIKHWPREVNNTSNNRRSALSLESSCSNESLYSCFFSCSGSHKSSRESCFRIPFSSSFSRARQNNRCLFSVSQWIPCTGFCVSFVLNKQKRLESVISSWDQFGGFLGVQICLQILCSLLCEHSKMKQLVAFFFMQHLRAPLHAVWREPKTRTFPQGESQDGSPGFDAFHSAKSFGLFFSLSLSSDTLRSPASTTQNAELEYRWVPVNPNMLFSKLAFVQSILKTTSQCLLCYSAHLIWNSLNSKEFCLALLFELSGRYQNGQRRCEWDTTTQTEKRCLKNTGGSQKFEHFVLWNNDHNKVTGNSSFFLRLRLSPTGRGSFRLWAHLWDVKQRQWKCWVSTL